MTCVKQAEGMLCPSKPQPPAQSLSTAKKRRCIRPACKPHSDAAGQPAALPSSEVTGPACHRAAKAQCPPRSGPETGAACQDKSPQKGKVHLPLTVPFWGPPHGSAALRSASACTSLGTLRPRTHPGTRQRNPASGEILQGGQAGGI